MDNTETIELNPDAEAVAGAASRGTKQSPKPTAVEPAVTAVNQPSQTGRSVSKRTTAKPLAAKGVGAGKVKKIATKHADIKPGNKNSGKSKKEQLICLLSKSGGMRVSVLVERLGWQAHTVRAALSGLRKQGFAISVSKSARTGETVYAITSAPDAATTVAVSA